MTVHSMGTKYEIRNVLKEGTKTSITSTWQWLSVLVELKPKCRATETCRCVPLSRAGTAAGCWWLLVRNCFELITHQPFFFHCNSLVWVICLNLNMSLQLLCFLTHGLFFQNQLKQTWHYDVSGLLCCLENWRHTMQLIFVLLLLSSRLLLHYFQHIIYSNKWFSGLNLVVTTKIIWNTKTH